MRQRAHAILLLLATLQLSAGARDWFPLQLSWWPIESDSFDSQLLPEHTDVIGLRLNPTYVVNRDVCGLDLGVNNHSGGDVNALQIGVLANCADADMGKSAVVRGLHIAGITNVTNADMRSLQIAGLVNLATGELGNTLLKGVQIAGLMNKTVDWSYLSGVEMRGLQIGVLVGNIADDMRGVQIGGCVNTAGDMDGLQLAVGVNTARENWMGGARDVDGVQLAGLGNMARRMRGGQLSIVLNRAEEQARGLQFALFNWAGGRDMKGVQIGLGNVAQTMSGLQLGLVNSCTHMYGLQIGLLNHINDGEFLRFFIIANGRF